MSIIGARFLNAQGQVLAVFMDDPEWNIKASVWKKTHAYHSVQYLHTGAFDEWKTVLSEKI
jgi:hypothetical protein